MKFVLFSDLHAHAFPEFGAESRLQDCISVLTDIRKYCVKHDIHDVVFGGDLFHKKGVIYTGPYVQVANELLAFKSAGISVFAVNGNHDDEDSEGKTHALQPLMAGGLLRGIGRKGYRTVVLGDCALTLFAYCDSKTTLEQRIKASREHRRAHRRRIAVFHHGFKGAKVGSVLEHEVKEPMDARELKLHKLYDMVFSGHYHTHQGIVGVPNGWYIGSPLEHTRSDRSEERKGFLVVDTDAMSFTRRVLDRPRFVAIAQGDVVDVKTVRGNFVDVLYDCADETLDAYLDSIRRLEPRGINPIAKPRAKQPAKKRLNVSPALSPVKVMRRYVKHKRGDIKHQNLDRAALVQLGIELVRTSEKKEK